MNTVQKGDEFEAVCLRLIQAALQEGKLGIMAGCARVFAKKGYYSEERKDDIIFDITIEVWPAGAPQYTLVYFIECKDYKGRIPVNRVEAFSRQIAQVAGLNAKSIFMARNGFQQGAYNIAESNGIMLLSVNTEADYEILLYKKEKPVGDELSLCGEEKMPLDLNDTSCLEIIIDEAIAKLFLQANREHGLSKLSKESLAALAEEELLKFDALFFTGMHSLTANKLCAFLATQYNIAVSELSHQATELGVCDAKSLQIKYHPKLRNSDRLLFVLAHEFGHFILHQRLRIIQSEYDSFEDSELNFSTGKYTLTNSKHWIEWQANYFAISLILPAKQVYLTKLWYQRHYGWRTGPLYLDDQQANKNTFYALVKKIAYTLNCTKTSVIYRLKELSLIEDKSRLRSIGAVIEEYKEGMFL